MLFTCLVTDKAFGVKLRNQDLRCRGDSRQKFARHCISSDKYADQCDRGYGSLQSCWSLERYADGILQLTIEGPRHSLMANCPDILLELAHVAWLAGDWLRYESWRTDVSPNACDLTPNPPLFSTDEERHPKSAKYRRRDRKRRQEQARIAEVIDSLDDCEITLAYCLSIVPCVAGVTAFRDKYFPGRDSVFLRELRAVRGGFDSHIKLIVTRFVVGHVLKERSVTR